MDDAKTEFASRLRAAREAAALSQEAVARHLDVALGTYANWERGKGSPQGWRIPSICALLGCKPKDILPA